MAVTRAATERSRIGSLYALVYRSGALVHKQTVAAAEVTGNGTAQPSVDLDYKLRTGDRVYVVANYAASVGTSLHELGTGAAESGLSALLVYANPVYGRVMQRSETQPMYGSVTWSGGSNTCELVRSLAKASVVLDDSGLFARKTLSFILAGAPQKTSMEVIYNTGAGKYEIPNAEGLGGTWNTAVNADDMIPLTGENYCAPYPISIDAGGVSVDKNTFDKRRSALILCAAAGETKEYYRLDFSRQLFSTSVGKDASNRIPRHRTQCALCLPCHGREKRRLRLRGRGVEKPRQPISNIRSRCRATGGKAPRATASTSSARTGIRCWSCRTSRWRRTS